MLHRAASPPTSGSTPSPPFFDDGRHGSGAQLHQVVIERQSEGMSSSPSVLARPDNGAATMAAASNTFHVLNSGSGAWGQANVGPYLRSPQAAVLRSPSARTAVTNYSYPANVAAQTDEVVARSPTPSQPLAPQMVQQLMILARWGTRSPWLPNYAFMSPQGPSPLLPYGHIGASSGAIVGVRGAGTVQTTSAGGGKYCPGDSSAGRRRPPNLKPLQIHAPATAAAGAGTAKNKAPPADDDNADGAVQRLAPVLAMPTTAGTHGKGKASPASNGRVWKRAAKDKDTDTPSASSKKPRQRVAAKQRPAGKDLVGSDLQIVSASPHPSNSRKRRNAPVAASSSNGRCSLVARRSYTGARKKHTVLTWLIDGGFLGDKDKVFYVPEDDGTGKVISGSVTRTGIHCSCCDATVPLPVFKAHAGREPGQKPWEKVLLASGKPLLRCMQEAWENERVMIFQAQEKVRAALEREKEKSAQAKRRLLAKQKRVIEAAMSPKMKTKAGDKDSSDDACGVCADGGELLCCDSCTSTFHPECLAMKVPEGSWVCHYCRCMMCMANDDDGLSTCQQCTRKYHQHCRPLLKNGDDIGAYCSETCKKLSAQLSDMIGVINHTEDGFSWTVLKIQKDEPSSSQGKPVVLESNVKLAVALGVLNECFNPVKDRRTKIDMLHQAVYSLGSEFKRVSYEGFYTVILEKDGEIISAALLRFHGTKLAEMPFAGTLPLYQRQGMMRRLLKGVEQVLASVQVERLLVPAIAERVETWTRSFSFRPVEPQLREQIKRLSLVVITGTTLLQKSIADEQQTTPDQPWWRKYTMAPTNNDEHNVARLTDDELAFLEMEPFCSFTDLVTGKVSLQRPCATNSSASMSPGSGGGGWRSCGEANATMTMMIQPSYVLHGMK